MRSIELFVGAGGSALGISRAGFSHLLVSDWDSPSCETIRGNQARGVDPVASWPLHEGDVRQLDYADIPEGLDLLAGGPPCQPFSLGGKHRGHRDRRDMFPEVVRAVRTIKPRAVFIENVRGLVRPAFSKYFSHILLQLTYPEVAPKKDESWIDHLSRLERHHTKGRHRGLHYRVVHRVLNAADYGVPQSRERVVIVAFRGDLGIEWSFPSPTHSRDALLHDQWATGDYWERHRIAKRKRPELGPSLRHRVDRLPSLFTPGDTAPWRTVRDALADLPEPSKAAQPKIPNHRFMPGARSYPGHTGSPYDLPAKTLKAGDHGVPGGENMLRRQDGSIRYFSVREACRLQTFPDEYTFDGVWSENMRQLGNAVPVLLAEKIATGIHERLAS